VYVIETSQNNTANGGDKDDANTGVSEAQYTTLLIVMPLFLFCYGGSCVAYVVYKIYRSCSHSALRDKFVQLHAAEYASQMMPPSYPLLPDRFKKEPCQPSAYIYEPMTVSSSYNVGGLKSAVIAMALLT